VTPTMSRQWSAYAAYDGHPPLITWPPSFADIPSRRMGMGMGESTRQIENALFIS
jgi:hypothetical protein